MQNFAFQGVWDKISNTRSVNKLSDQVSPIVSEKTSKFFYDLDLFIRISLDAI